MKYGIRDICDVVFKAKKAGKLGGYHYSVGQPVLYIDSAKTSTLEGAASTVYATGGRGNSRLIAWEGEKTLTFTVEDAVMSDKSFAMLSGAGLILDPGKGINENTHFVHYNEIIDLKYIQTGLNKVNFFTLGATSWSEDICKELGPGTYQMMQYSSFKVRDLINFYKDNDCLPSSFDIDNYRFVLMYYDGDVEKWPCYNSPYGTGQEEVIDSGAVLDIDKHIFLGDLSHSPTTYKDFRIVLYGSENIPVDELVPPANALEGQISAINVWETNNNKCKFTMGTGNIKSIFLFPLINGTIKQGYAVNAVSADSYRGETVFSNIIPSGRIDLLNLHDKIIPTIIDYYAKSGRKMSELVIDAANFADNYYVEAKTTFKRQYDGKELDAMITFPNVKVQSNFTFNMAATGDPSTFTFTMDAMPGTTVSNPSKKVLCEMFIVDDEAINANTEASIDDNDSVLKVYEEKARVYLDESGTTTYTPLNPRSMLWYESERKLYNSQYVDTIINTSEDNTDRAYYVGEYLYGKGVDAKVYDRWHVDNGDNGFFEDTEDRQNGGYIYVLTEKK